MAKAKGSLKTGGRKKGTPNGRTIIKQEEHLDFVKCTVERVLREYGRIAFLDIGQAFQPDGSLKPIHEIPEDIRRSIAGIEVVNIGDGEGKLHKIKILDKTKALQDLGKHLGMFIEKVEMKAEVDFGSTWEEFLVAYGKKAG